MSVIAWFLLLPYPENACIIFQSIQQKSGRGVKGQDNRISFLELL
jgi:hypothetical protein